jgi:hypothetical protein
VWVDFPAQKSVPMPAWFKEVISWQQIYAKKKTPIQIALKISINYLM